MLDDSPSFFASSSTNTTNISPLARANTSVTATSRPTRRRPNTPPRRRSWNLDESPTSTYPVARIPKLTFAPSAPRTTHAVSFPPQHLRDAGSDNEPGPSRIMPAAPRTRLQAKRATQPQQVQSQPHHQQQKGCHKQLLPVPIDDDDGVVFLASTPTHTPAKRPAAGRTALSPLAINSTTAPRPVKRKPAASTPIVRTPPVLTPLRTTAGGPFGFDRLAPLAAPSFAATARTPQTKADADAFLHHQTDSMTRLRIGDRTDCSSLANDRAGDQVVPAAISPDGHVTKRRVRSRPVSTELHQTQLPPVCIHWLTATDIY
jgi:hypothetical protein